MGESTSNQFTEKEKDICVFFSFDMVGSTKFKTKDENWPFAISRFYSTVYDELSSKIPQIKVWKYLGDEILLYVSIRDFDSPSKIYEIPKMVYDIQLDVAAIIQEEFSSPELNVKSTIWIAGAQTVKSWQKEKNESLQIDPNYKNISVHIQPGKKEEVVGDFLGPDMDLGFRVAKFAFHHKVVLSADFAYLLYKMPKIKDLEIGYKIDDNLRIVSYEILKGVWDEQYYPIIWYYPHWDTAPYDFFYADHKKNDIAERVLSERIEEICKLRKVYEELGKTAEIDAFVKECLDRLK